MNPRSTHSDFGSSWTPQQVRWGLLLVALVAGVGLIGSTVAGWRFALEMRETVAMGQAEQLMMRYAQTLAGKGKPPTQDELDAFLEENQADGLKYIGILRRTGVTVVEAGTLGAPLELETLRKGPQSLMYGSLVRTIRPQPRPQGVPPGSPGLSGDQTDPQGEAGSAARAGTSELESKDAAADSRDSLATLPAEAGHPRPLLGQRPGPGQRPPPGMRPLLEGRPPLGEHPPLEAPPGFPSDTLVLTGEASARRPELQEGPRGRGPGGQGPVLILDVEPLQATQLLDRAVLLMGVGVTTGGLLVLLALLFWRMSRQAEAMQASLEAQRRLAALGQMSAVLAHEIKNPLASLKGHAQLLHELLEPDSKPRTRAERVVKEAVRLEQLVLQLLDFVRTGKVERQPHPVLGLLENAAREVSPERVDVIADPGLESFPLDAARMHQVLTNLLRNALQAAPADTRVELVAKREGRALSLEVLDRGPGLPDGDPDTLFEPFHTRRAQGVGLGLAVARRIVEAHSGQIRAQNREGGGARFCIVLPPPALEA